MANSITKHIPNAITCCNLICGCIAAGAAFRQEFTLSIIMIFAGAVFDFFDGMTARLLNVSSPIGKELDSLADVVTFGVAPSAMLYSLFGLVKSPVWLEPVANYMPYTAFLMAAFSALRLAKFNLDERQTSSFIGVPTPANALFWCSLIGGGDALLQSEHFNSLYLFVLMMAFSLLLVCELPMFALKFKNLSWKDNKIKYIFLLTSIPIFIFLGKASFAVIVIWYILLSAIQNKITGKAY